MSVELTEERDARVLTIQASGKLTADDYHRFVPEMERLIDKHGKSCQYRLRNHLLVEPQPCYANRDTTCQLRK
jgi:hypothetical protein